METPTPWYRSHRKQLFVVVMFLASFLCFIYSVCFTCCAVIRRDTMLVYDADSSQQRGDRLQLVHGASVVRKSLLQATGADYLRGAEYEEEEDEGIDSQPQQQKDTEQRSYSITSTLNSYQNATKRLPTALIIGVKKGGTRALLEFLRIHPNVRATGPEVHFFDRNFEFGLDWYRQQMPPTLPGQLTMEKTPSYFITKSAPRRIYNMSKKTKLVIVVRDPVMRAISDYTQTASKRPNIKSFEQLAFLNPNTGLVNTSWGAIKIGVYARHLERWLKYFPMEQILIVSGEELITNPAKVMEDTQDFLGLRRIVSDKHFFFNATKGFPCVKKSAGKASPHCLGKTKGRPHPVIDPKAIQRLRAFYRPFNAKFYQMVNRDFGWH